jgi:hypothetical protein
VWSVQTGVCIGVIGGASDTSNLARGSRYIEQTHETGETSFLSSLSGEVTLWFPGVVGMLTALADGSTWAGMNRTGQVYILRLEGPQQPIVPALSLVPLLNRYWRAGAYQYLRQADYTQAEAMIVHRERICNEFTDAAGLAECAEDRIRVQKHNVHQRANAGVAAEEAYRVARATGDRTLLKESLFEQIRSLLRQDSLNEKAAPLLDELASTCRDLGEFEGVRVALTLKLEIWKDGTNDAALLANLKQLAETARQLDDTEYLMNILGMQTEVLERMQGHSEAIQITFEMERLSRSSNQVQALIGALRQRVRLCKSANDLQAALDASQLIVQVGGEANDLQTVQAALAEQAFIHMDTQSGLAGEILDNQEQVCRQLGDPQLLAVCLINNSLTKTGEKAPALAKAREAQQLIELYALDDLKPKIGPVLAHLASR